MYLESQVAYGQILCEIVMIRSLDNHMALALHKDEYMTENICVLNANCAPECIFYNMWSLKFNS